MSGAWRWACLALLPLAGCASAPDGAADRPPQARAAPGWDRAFTRDDGWTGADGAYSLELPDGRVLWLFSDTWIGPVRQGKHAQGSTLVNNSLGLHPRSRDGAAPAPQALSFAWGAEDPARPGTPGGAWIAPQLPGEAPRGWYWLSDAALVPGGPQGRRLVIFLQHIGPRPGGEGVWAFQSLGSALAVIDDWSGPPAGWRARQVRIPQAVGAEQATPDRPETSWGAAVLLREEAGQELAYVYGVREDPGHKRLLVARAPAGELGDPGAWRFFDGSSWVDDAARAAPVADELVNELSVDEVAVEGRPCLVMVHSQPAFGDQVLGRTARRPEGPWSPAAPLLRVEEVRRHASYFTYAGKAHAELSRPGELLVTWVLNAHDFEAMVADAEIYRPRFARVPLSLFPAPP